MVLACCGTHTIAPCLLAHRAQANIDKLDAAIEVKTNARDELRRQLSVQKDAMTNVQADAAAIIASARARTSKLMVWGGARDDGAVL
jgi:hypothetical protein